MAGTRTILHNKYLSRQVTTTRYFVGSFWREIGAPAFSVLSDSPSSEFLEWSSTRETNSQSPFWRDLIKSGHNATTTLIGTKTQLEAKTGNVQYRVKTNEGLSTEYHDVHRYEGHILYFGPHDGGFVDDLDADNLAAEDFYKKARSAQTQVQTGVIAGEALQTLRGLKSNARTIRNLLDGYLDNLKREKSKRGRARRLREYTKKEIVEYVADQWLSLMFNIKPLINDCDDALKYFAEDTEIRTPSVMVKGEASLVAKMPLGVINAGNGFTHDINVEDEVSVKYKGRVRRHTVGGSGVSVDNATRAGVGLSNFLPTLWELIPYSFIVDYFSNVQEVVSAYSFASDTVMWVNRTTRRVVKTRNVGFNPSGLPLGGTVDIPNPGEFTWTKTTIFRIGGVQNPSVSLRFGIPGATSLKWANMAALIVKSKSMAPYYW